MSSADSPSKSSNSRWLVAASLGLLLAGAANATVIYDSSNKDFVFNGPSILPVFTISTAWEITDIQDYHWNYGSGQDPAAVHGTVSLFDTATDALMGSWDAVALPIGNPNTNWVVHPNIVLQPGTYKIVDSALATWSYSTTNDWGFLGYGANWAPNVGFSVVSAVPVPEPASVAMLCAGLALTGWAVRRRRAEALDPTNPPPR
jgi:hypothetical protein